ELQFVLKAGNGEVILTSEAYPAKASCLNGIESVKKNSTDDNRYDRKEAKNAKHLFNPKPGNGQISGPREMYESAAGRDKGIESVKRNAPDATTDDQSE